MVAGAPSSPSCSVECRCREVVRGKCVASSAVITVALALVLVQGSRLERDPCPVPELLVLMAVIELGG